MKFMKLGNRPDTFYTTEAVRSVSSEVSSDVIIQIEGTRYLLHKFPLLSKCLHLHKLCSQTPDHESSHLQVVQLPDFPGGHDSFELCAKFCYGITITLSAHNIVPARCAAEYLQMTEDAEKGNLISKLEAFFTSCILNGWRDVTVTLQSTKAFPMWCEDLGITSRCVEAIASKVLSNPTKVNLSSHSFSRRGRGSYVVCNGSNEPSRGWWGDDLADLGIDLYWRAMIAIKSGGRVSSNLIGDSLRIYASRWLPNVWRNNTESDGHEVDSSSKHRLILESIVSLLPVEKGAVPCSFLMELLKTANAVKSSVSSKTELATRVGLQLEEVTVGDLLVLCLGPGNEASYDVDVVLNILEEFKLQGQSPQTSPPRNKEGFVRRRSRSAENIDLEFQESRRSSSASHSVKIKVAKLVDGYLQEIAKDKNLNLSKFISVAEAVPEFARVDHDDLYNAIDIYLKGHPELDKSERKLLCRILDCKKLSVDACMHAAQNEMLPLRVVVQVLLTTQKTPLKPTTASLSTNAPEDQWSASGLKTPKSNLSTLKMKLAEDEDDLDENFEKSSKLKSLSMIQTRPKRIFSKLWPINRSTGQKNRGNFFCGSFLPG